MRWALSLAEERSPDVVVLCEDDGTRDALRYWLEVSGLSALVARTGYEARPLLQSAAAVTLITDRMLPPWPGLASFAGLKRERANMTIAYLDDGIPDNRTLARSAGADVILYRPFTRAQVISACSAGANMTVAEARE